MLRGCMAGLERGRGEAKDEEEDEDHDEEDEEKLLSLQIPQSGGGLGRSQHS